MSNLSNLSNSERNPPESKEALVDMTTPEHHHGDGEIPAITDLEILRVLLPRDCEHCGGLLLIDRDEPTAFRCSECGRDPEAKAIQPVYIPSGHVVNGLTARSGRRELGIPTGFINPAIRRFS